MSGWIKLHRSIKDHWLYSEKRKFSRLEAWIDLLINCNHENSKSLIGNSIIECNRGQSILSLDSWSKRWGWNKSAVRRFFDLLEGDKMIEMENVQKTTRITVCNYDSYQGLRNDDETELKQSRHAVETQAKRKRNANETRSTPIKECKEDKEGEEEKEFKKDISQNKKFGVSDFRQTLIDLNCDPQHVDDWIKVRRAKSASFTATSLQLLFDECEKHNFSIPEAVKICAGRNWQGFKYQWLLNEQKNASTTNQNRQQRADDLSQLGELAKSVIRGSH